MKNQRKASSPDADVVSRAFASVNQAVLEVLTKHHLDDMLHLN
jgi:hypothetical protein